MVSKDNKLSVRRQCALLTLARSNLYYEPKGESAENLRFMALIHCPAGAWHGHAAERGQAVLGDAVVRIAPNGTSYEA
jgi:hypothetical protein